MVEKFPGKLQKIILLKFFMYLINTTIWNVHKKFTLFVFPVHFPYIAVNFYPELRIYQKNLTRCRVAVTSLTMQ